MSDYFCCVHLVKSETELHLSHRGDVVYVLE